MYCMHTYKSIIYYVMSNPYCKEDPLAEYKKYRFTWRDLSFLRHKCDFFAIFDIL